LDETRRDEIHPVVFVGEQTTWLDSE
jgi:hypothetical protein